jgi:poly-beta-hydroxyalkanoate depolymerase
LKTNLKNQITRDEIKNKIQLEKTNVNKKKMQIREERLNQKKK